MPSAVSIASPSAYSPAFPKGQNGYLRGNYIMLNTIRIGVLDKQEVVRYGLCKHLADQSGMSIAGSYRDAANALLAAGQGKLDLLLMSHRHEQTDVLGLIETLSKEQPALKVLILITQPDANLATSLLTLGGHGVICKTQPLTAYVDAIRALVAGKSYCFPQVMDDAAERSVPDTCTRSAEPTAPLLLNPALSLREREVLRLCASGLTVTRIASMFGRSVKTVSAQKLAAYRKLGLKNDMDLFRNLSRYTS
jgi:two-component system capsular synthesis response regulator RcsB